LNLIVTIIEVIFISLYFTFVCHVILYPIERELSRIADFLTSFEVTIDEKDDTNDTYKQ